MTSKRNEPPFLEIKKFTIQEIEQGIKRIYRRIKDVAELLDNRVSFNDSKVKNVEANIRETIREVFGQNSPEFRDHQHHKIWYGGYNMFDQDDKRQSKFESGIPKTITMLKGHIERLEEKREDIGVKEREEYIAEDFWNDIHHRITSIARLRFKNSHYADAVESALKEVNVCVKEIVKRKAGIERDGADLMHKAFSPSSPIIVLGDLSTESGRNIQQGYMEIFAGAMSGIRNPKTHDNLDITADRAKHFIYLTSLLMQKIDERIE